jgi:hypothetical protein
VVRVNGVKFGLYLPEDRFAKTPDWQPGQGDPPLPLDEAIAVALRWAKAKHAAADLVAVREIELVSARCDGVASRWYYGFSFLVRAGGSASVDADTFAAILMDGTVVELRPAEGDE